VPAQPPRGELAPIELYFHSGDLDAAIARLASAGARPLSPRAPRDWGDEAAYFADPDGNVLVAFAPRAKSRHPQLTRCLPVSASELHPT
jgi:predicted enzyme related to lactoylglutathione lyase